jgi:bifunctional non-homologous end joining protein LigD
VRYYESIGEWMLPHLKGRPVSLVRGPRGISGQLFFQHDDNLSIPGLRELDPALWPGHTALLEVPTAEALVSAAQMNVIEFHTWNSTRQARPQAERSGRSARPASIYPFRRPTRGPGTGPPGRH